jgi:Adenylate and Guanylate cyclase catalytic domain
LTCTPFPKVYNQPSETRKSTSKVANEMNASSGLDCNDEEIMVFSSESEEPRHHSPLIEQDDSPEVIVRRENQVIRLLRIVTGMFLLLAAAATVTFIYLYLSQNQMDRFRSEYNALASTLVSSLHLDLRLNFWTAHTISKAVSLAIAMGNQPVTNFTIPDNLWDGVTQVARWSGEGVVASWIPFLYTDQQRIDFEAHVRTIDAGRKGEDPCYICGGPGLVVQDESASAEIASVSFTCGEAYRGGLNGAIPRDVCDSAQVALAEMCPCKPMSTYTAEVENGQTPTWSLSDGLYTFLGEDQQNITRVSREFGQAPYAPMYAISTRVDENIPPLYDLLSDPVRGRALTAAMFNGKGAISEMKLERGSYHDMSSDLYYPVFSDESQSRRVIGAIGLEFFWRGFITGAVPSKSDLVLLVIENTCGQAHSYVIDPIENSLSMRGITDLHDSKYDSMARSTSYEDYDTIVRTTGSLLEQAEYCSYKFVVYPTQVLENQYMKTNSPTLYASMACLIFVFTTLVFLSYDVMVRRRQAKVMASAKRTNDIVSSLFPENVRARLYERAAATGAPNFAIGAQDSQYFASSRSTAMTKSSSIFGSDPIADLFPHTTVMFLDIAGFTAWSSEREPSQVFMLLESLYHAFDSVARQLGVFKVETIGDSYVAVAGLPKPRKDHAVGKWKEPN